MKYRKYARYKLNQKCIVLGCEFSRQDRMMCYSHAASVRKRKRTLAAGKKTLLNKCFVWGCDAPYSDMGMCEQHYRIADVAERGCEEERSA